MTLSYDIIMPMIVAVAMSVGVRRLACPESIYSLKLVRRGNVIPQALHANMFLVRRAKDVMDPDVTVLPAETSFDDFLKQPGHEGRLRHVVVTKAGRFFGVIRVNTGLRRGLEAADTGVTLGAVANRNFIVVRERDAVFDVIGRLWRKRAFMALVVAGVGPGAPRVEDVVGVITKEHVADAVANSMQVYPRG
jgi:CIC family chloride channel protein